MKTRKTLGSSLAVAGGVGLAVLFSFSVALGQTPPPKPTPIKLIPEPAPGIPGSLKTIPVPEPPDLALYVRDRAAAMKLGKALFWDMQLGSDNQACASCHFHAGADDRATGQLDPGLRSVTADHTYQLGGPNFQLKGSNFPFHKLSNPDDRTSGVLFDTNDVVSSMGTYFAQFQQINPGKARDSGLPLADPDFNVGGVKVRRVPPRNTPSVINAVFNVHNFWDGRASYYFNGNNPFGPLDMNSGIFVTATDGSLQKQIIRIAKASLASQAVGPPLSEMEMSFLGRTWPDVGKKMLTLKPLGMQIVHPADSVLGPLSNALKVNGVFSGPGLNTDYVTMIKAAFWDQYWNSPMIVKFVNGAPVFSARPNRPLNLDEFAQMEANFAFFFGMAIQTYESTLVSDDSPFDRYAESPFVNPLTLPQQLGMAVYMARGRCANCHTGAEFTNASLSFRDDPTNRIELMPIGAPVGPPPPPGGDPVIPSTAFYDGGWYNTGTRLTNDDIGRGGDSPFINPMTGAPFPLSYSKLGLLARQGLLPGELAAFTAVMPGGAPSPDPNRTGVDGCFKTPSLRNVELTGPYFHNGGMATLRQVVDHYDRGGDFTDQNIYNVHPDITNLLLTAAEKTNLVAFLLALTDDRVRQEKAPFDHPQLFVPDGSKRNSRGVIIGNFDYILPNGFRATEQVREVPAVGALGLPGEGLPPLRTFLNLDQFKADTTVP